MTSRFIKKCKEEINVLDSPFREDSLQTLEKLVSAGIHELNDLAAFVAKSIDKESELQIFGIWLLGRLPSEEALQSLLVALENKSLIYRCEAAISLGRLGDPSSLPSLIQHLYKDVEPKVQGCCASALSDFSDSSIAPALCDILKDTTRHTVARDHAAEALANFPSERARLALRQALGDSDTEIQYSAAFSFGQIGTTDALPDLRKILDIKLINPDTDIDLIEMIHDAIREIEKNHRLGKMT